MFLQIIKELANQDARRRLGIVFCRSPAVADVEDIARREQGLEEKLSIVAAQRTIAGTRVLRDEIESQRSFLTRKRGIVHAEQTNHLEGDSAHRLERTES